MDIIIKNVGSMTTHFTVGMEWIAFNAWIKIRGIILTTHVMKSEEDLFYANLWYIPV